ncbi:HU family DNA-binding protein [Serinibacter salmoneus]|uniref:Nucleoid DNA-binding protein n=1 Tax=Serinibacter salmoneus TaxID=556530 RepID=A0A2A9D1X4_9MICO|nr:HU family DNA-binding protein [Serinibacter salmoneus]PFG20718.1 nucleoid DNA-binding protein [Serinibacter salmoneus]
MTTAPRVSKRALIHELRARTGLSARESAQAYEAFTAIIGDHLRSGTVVSMTGFGAFRLKPHRGHPAQFGASDGRVPDYNVVTFKASDTFRRTLPRSG